MSNLKACGPKDKQLSCKVVLIFFSRVKDGGLPQAHCLAPLITLYSGSPPKLEAWLPGEGSKPTESGQTAKAKRILATDITHPWLASFPGLAEL